jgi:hypothetical protein
MAEVGRPAHYTTPGDLEAKVQEYFADPDTKPTITGLAYHLGFESRQSLYDYEQKGEFSYIIKRARLRVEMGYENDLRGNNAAGPIFALKNMGWKDHSRTELTGADGEKLGPIIQIIRNDSTGSEGQPNPDGNKDT